MTKEKGNFEGEGRRWWMVCSKKGKRLLQIIEVFRSVIIIIFYLKKYQNNIFYFLKIIFNIIILKLYENTKKFNLKQIQKI